MSAWAVLAAYGLDAPSLQDAHAAVERVHGEDTERAWTALLDRAQQIGKHVTIDTVVAAMKRDREPVVRLCGQALYVRLQTYDHFATEPDLAVH